MPKILARSSSRKKAKQVFLWLVGLLIMVWTIAPFYWLMISTLQPENELLRRPPTWFPTRPSLDNYKALLKGGPEMGAAVNAFKPAVGNSVIIACLTTLIVLGLGSLAAYSFARLEFKGKDPLLISLMFIRMVPIIGLLVPLYMLITKARLLDSRTALIILYTAINLPFAIWIMRGYFKTIPSELEDAAKIDGCTNLKVLRYVILPLATPGLVATGIFVFLAAWNEFTMALIFTMTVRAKTIPVVIVEFSGKYTVDYAMMSTGALIATLPPLLLAALFRKHIVKGLTAGAVKG